MVLNFFCGGLHNNRTYVQKNGNKRVYNLNKVVFYTHANCGGECEIDLSTARFYTMTLDCKGVSDKLTVFKRREDLFLDDEQDVVIVEDSCHWGNNEAEYSIYIPCESVGFSFFFQFTEENERYEWERYRYTLKSHLGFGDLMEDRGIRLNKHNEIEFDVIKNYRNNKRYREIENIKDVVERACNITIGSYEWEKFIELFKVKRLTSGEPKMYERDDWRDDFSF